MNLDLDKGDKLLAAVVFHGHWYDLEHPHAWSKTRSADWQSWAVKYAPALMARCRERDALEAECEEWAEVAKRMEAKVERLLSLIVPPHGSDEEEVRQMIALMLSWQDRAYVAEAEVARLAADSCEECYTYHDWDHGRFHR